MGKVILEAIIIIAIPTAVFFGGAWLMAAISGRDYVKERLEQAPEADRKPLNQRLGYDIGAVQRHWGALDDRALRAEQWFLELDLFFPLLYGGALAFSLLMARAALGWTLGPVWFLAPVAIIELADWTENAAQLSQIERLLITPAAALQANWIRIASIATTLKLVFLGVASLLLVLLVVVILVSASKSS